MVQGSWESENVTPSNPSIPLTPPPPPPQPPQLTPSPQSSSSDTSSWQPAPFNSLQHLLGLGNHWCSAPSAATTPAPSLVGLSHLGPYDGGISGEGCRGGGCRLTSQKGAVKSEKKIKTSVIGVGLTVTSFLLCPSSHRSNFCTCRKCFVALINQTMTTIMYTCIT